MPSLKYRSALLQPLRATWVLVPMNWVVYDFICASALRFGRACGTVEKVFHRIVGANSYVRPNATYLHDLYIHPSNLCNW